MRKKWGGILPKCLLPRSVKIPIWELPNPPSLGEKYEVVYINCNEWAKVGLLPSSLQFRLIFFMAKMGYDFAKIHVAQKRLNISLKIPPHHQSSALHLQWVKSSWPSALLLSLLQFSFMFVCAKVNCRPNSNMEKWFRLYLFVFSLAICLFFCNDTGWFF